VKLFMKTVGVPGFVLAIMQLTPVWSKLTASAHTLPDDFAAMGDSQRGAPLPDEVATMFRSITASTAVLVGGKSPSWMKHSTKRAAESIANAKLVELPGQTHTASPKSLAPALRAHFANLTTERREEAQSMSSRYV
jgi:hypothetical protein